MRGDNEGSTDGGVSVTRTVTIRNRRGLHARAAAKMVKMASGFDAEITVGKGAQTVSGISIMGLMTLAAAAHSEITLSATGPQAEAALNAVSDLIANKFEED